MNKLIDYLGDRLETVVKICFGILAFVLAYSMYVDKSHAHTWVEQNVPFFWSLFGFAAAAIIIGVAYWFGHSGIMARKDFYDEESTSQCCCSGSTKKSSSEQA